MSTINSLIQSISSALASFQNISANLETVDIPDWVRSVINFFVRVAAKVFQWIPSIPAFDVRAQLMILALGVPFILDVIFVWLVSEFTDVVCHIADLLAAIVSSVIISQAIIERTIRHGAIIAACFCGVFWILRFISIKLSKRHIDWKLQDLIEFICSSKLKNVVKEDYELGKVLDRNELRKAIKNYCKMVEVGNESRGKKSSKSCHFLWIFFFAMCLVAAVTLWSVQIIPIACPEVLSSFFPYVGWPVTAVLLIAFIVQFPCSAFERGRQFMRKMIKRYGFRLMMFVLNLLYMPIISNLVVLITPTETGCDSGYYLDYERVPPPVDSSTFWLFVNHTAKCRRCDSWKQANMDICKSVCSGSQDLRLLQAPEFRFFKDILMVSGGMLLYCAVVLIGMPWLWTFIIRQNKKCLRYLYVYGKEVEDKWKPIVHRLDTTGIYLFRCYHYDSSYWDVWLLMAKLVVMIFTTLGSYVMVDFLWVLPAFYFVVVLTYAVKLPYFYKANNILDIALYVVNGAVSLIPLFNNYHYNAQSALYLPLTAIIAIIPIVGIIMILRSQSLIVFDEDDPTFTEEEKKEQKVGKRDTKVRKTEKDEDKVDKSENLDDLSEVSSSSDEGDEDDQPHAEKPTTPLNVTEQYELDRRLIEPIWLIESSVYNNAARVTKFQIDPDEMPKKFKKLYEKVDDVIDGSTTELLTKYLRIMMIVGAVGFGWYLGGLYGSTSSETLYDCS